MTSSGADVVATAPAARLRASVAAVVTAANTRRPMTRRAEALRRRPGVVVSQRRHGIPCTRSPRAPALAPVGATVTLSLPALAGGPAYATAPLPTMC